MRICIVGGGALGCLLGGLLGRAGNEITLVHKKRSVVGSIRKRGVRIRETDGRTITTGVKAKLAPADLSREDLVVFAVKSYDTLTAALSHKRRVSKKATILTLQNGLGNVEVLSQVFGNTTVLGGTTTEASLLLGPGHVAHTGRGETRIGEIDRQVSERVRRIAREFEKAGIKTRTTNNPYGVIWTKAILNAAVNPISALLGVSNGALATEPGLVRAMLSIVRESVAVSRAVQVRLEPPHPERLLLPILRATAPNRSSMLQDLDRGKVTEIHQLNGALEHLGKKHGISTPLNQLLTSMIVTAERAHHHTPDIASGFPM